MEKKIRRRPSVVHHLVALVMIVINCMSCYGFLYGDNLKMEEYTFETYLLDAVVLLLLPLLCVWLIRGVWRGRHRYGLLLSLMNTLFYASFFALWEAQLASRCILANFSVDLFELKRGLLIVFGVIALVVVLRVRQTVIHEEG